MNEEKLLNRALAVLEAQGINETYVLLLAEKDTVTTPGSQLYNFLTCLAALCGKADDALCYLEQAILQKGMWYRPEVFADEDLALIAAHSRFAHCRAVSQQRYYAAAQSAATVCTWAQKTAPKLALALHGNQQNIALCRQNWAVLAPFGYQTEYVQSRTVDSFGIYRWEDGDTPQLPAAVQAISAEYEEYLLCGFSAGAGEILRSLCAAEFACERLIVCSPWLAEAEMQANEIAAALHRRGTRVCLVCGSADSDCLPIANALSQAFMQHGVPCKAEIITGLAHEMEPQLPQILQRFFTA